MRILVAEDDPDSLFLLGATLELMGHAVQLVKNGREAKEALRSGEFRILLSDWKMPELDGLELARELRADQSTPYVYMILLTGQGGKHNYLDAIAAGVDDVISKPFDWDCLAARLHVAERILRLHEQLRAQATIDVLTGVWNRGTVLDCLSQELERVNRENSSLEVLMVDVDHFKRVNDTHGHLTGDAVLRETAQRMKDTLRTYDRIGRYGGEEFLIVVPTRAPGEALEVAERVRRVICERPMTGPAGQIIITASVGIAVSTPDRRGSPHSLISAADAALYRAKSSGRNCVVCADV